MRVDILPRVNAEINENETIDVKQLRFTNALREAVGVVDDVFDYFGLEAKGKKPVFYVNDAALGAEEYRICATAESIRIAAGSDAGAFYAVCTLAQLFAINCGKVNAFTLADKPDRAYRAVSDDISRGQISTIEGFKSIIRRLAIMKYNVYMPYIEDTFKFEFSPDFGKYSDPVPASEWKDIIAYAAKYHVSVRPIVNMLAHWDKNSYLADFQKYILKFEDVGAERKPYSDCLDPRLDGTREMLCKMLDEIVDCFGKGVIHVGGDEPSQFISILGAKEAAKVYVEHFAWLREEIEKRGCTMMLYGDAFGAIWDGTEISEDEIKRIGDATFVYWDYEPKKEYPVFERIKRSGVKYAISGGTWSWGRLIPSAKSAFDDLKAIARLDKKCDTYIVSSWNDRGWGLREESFAGWCAGAQFAWKYDAKFTYDDAMKSYFEFMFGICPDKEMCDTVYRSDEHFIKNEAMRGSELLASEFFRDARRFVPTEPDMPRLCSEIYPDVAAAEEYFSELKPKRNDYTYRCFLFDLHRLVWVLMRDFVVPALPHENREQARSIIDDLIPLAEDVDEMKKANKALWFEQNRLSEWYMLESRYIDIEQSLYALIRFCKFGPTGFNNRYF